MRLSRQRNGRRGAATVEFALVAPVFLLMIFGIVELGRAVMVQQTLINATREGARKAIFSDATTNDAKSAVVSHLANAGIDISGDLVSVAPQPENASHGDSITVTVIVPFSDIAWIPSSFLGDSNLSASTTMSCERTD